MPLSRKGTEQRTCEGSLFSSTEEATSDCFIELAAVTEDVIAEEVEGAEEDTGEVVLLIDKALTNLSPKEPRS